MPIKCDHSKKITPTRQFYANIIRHVYVLGFEKTNPTYPTKINQFIDTVLSFANRAFASIIRQIGICVFPKVEEFLIVLDGELSIPFLFIDLPGITSTYDAHYRVCLKLTRWVNPTWWLCKNKIKRIWCIGLSQTKTINFALYRSNLTSLICDLPPESKVRVSNRKYGPQDTRCREDNAGG